METVVDKTAVSALMLSVGGTEREPSLQKHLTTATVNLNCFLLGPQFNWKHLKKEGVQTTPKNRFT